MTQRDSFSNYPFMECLRHSWGIRTSPLFPLPPFPFGQAPAITEVNLQIYFLHVNSCRLSRLSWVVFWRNKKYKTTELTACYRQMDSYFSKVNLTSVSCMTGFYSQERGIFPLPQRGRWSMQLTSQTQIQQTLRTSPSTETTLLVTTEIWNWKVDWILYRTQ